MQNEMEVSLSSNPRDWNFRYVLKPGEDLIIREITASVGVFHPDEIDIAQELATESIQKGPDKSGYHFAICEYKSRPIGYTCYGEIPCTKDRYDLYWIVVLHELRGVRIGQKLMQVTEGKVKESGGKKIYIETSSRDPYLGTRKFYEKCGYMIEAIFKDFYDDGDDKWVFVKNL